MIDLWNKKVTIYNDIPGDNVNPRKFQRFVINNCQIQGGYVSTTEGTIQNIVNAKTVITKDIKKYVEPLKYMFLPSDIKELYYTVQIGDFVIFEEIDDIVNTAQEFAKLQQKYNKNGMVISSVSVNINGMDVDNITMNNT